MESNENIEQSLLNTIKNDNLKDLSTDYSELALDSFLNDGVLRDIPFFGTLYKGYKGVLGIRDALFAQKVYKFLTQIKSVPVEERINFIEEIESKKNENIKVGQTLLLIIDKLDDLDKARIIGNLFKATIKKQINYDEFMRLSSIVQKAFNADLLKLSSSSYYEESTKDHFISIGLMKLKLGKDLIKSQATIDGGEPELMIDYEMTELSRKLYKFGLNSNS